MRIRKHLSVVAALGVGAAALVSAPSAHASTPFQPVVGPVTASGDRVVDGNGQTLILRGIHRDGAQSLDRSVTPNVLPNFPDLAEIQTIGASKWHANVVRVPVGAAQWTGLCPSLYSATEASAYQHSVDQVISDITGNGMVALLDLHTVAPGCKKVTLATMPDESSAVAFWDSAAARYAGNSRVAFELWNEPHGITESHWRYGQPNWQDCVAPPAGADAATILKYQACKATAPKYTTVGMQILHDHVFAHAPGHLIVVDGFDTATAPPTSLLTVSQTDPAPATDTAYAVHPYTCSDPSSCSATLNHSNTTALDRFRHFQDAFHAPVLITEFGWPTFNGSGSPTGLDGTAFYSQTLDYALHPATRTHPTGEGVGSTWGFSAFAFDGSPNANGAYDLITDRTTFNPNTTAGPLYATLTNW